MIVYDDFLDQMKRLHSNFGQAPRNDSEVRRLSDKVNGWYELWQKSCFMVSFSILEKMVDKAGNECDRLPSFAQLRSLRRIVQGELPSQGYDRTPCGACRGGIVIGWAHVDRYGPVEYVFRCSSCENWRGQYDGLPVWDPSGSFTAGLAPKDSTVAPAKEFAPREIPSAGYPALSASEKDYQRSESLREDQERGNYDAYADLGFGKS
jgi:hypothetical protein